MLARSKLNSIESTISRALIDNEISHKDFTTFIDEDRTKRKYKNLERKKQNRKK